MNKREQVKKVYLDNKNIKDRDKLVNIITNSVNVTEGTARTYLSLAIKDHTVQSGKDYTGRNINSDSLKREQAKKVFNSSPNLSRKELIDVFVDTFDMTRQSASTHCTMFSKELVEDGVTTHKALESMRNRKP